MKQGWSSVLGAICALGMSHNAFAYVVDGNLGDWGVTVADHVGSCGNNTPTSCIGSSFGGVTGAPGLVGYMIEDTNDVSNSYLLGPNYGGQNYDAEFLGVSIENGVMYIAIATGQRADNGFAGTGKGLYSPGDILIRSSAGLFGIEVGGGAVGSSGAIALGDAGTTYLLDSHGYTTGSTAEPGRLAGSVWRDTTWLEDPIAPASKVQIASGTLVGNATAYKYTGTTSTNQHAVIEVAVSLGLFGNAVLNGVEWRPSCGNDELLADILLQPSPEISTVPEPATWLLMTLAAGVVPVATRRRRVTWLSRDPASPVPDPVDGGAGRAPRRYSVITWM